MSLPSRLRTLTSLLTSPPASYSARSLSRSGAHCRRSAESSTASTSSNSSTVTAATFHFADDCLADGLYRPLVLLRLRTQVCRDLVVLVVPHAYRIARRNIRLKELPKRLLHRRLLSMGRQVSSPSAHLARADCLHVVDNLHPAFGVVDEYRVERSPGPLAAGTQGPPCVPHPPCPSSAPWETPPSS